MKVTDPQKPCSFSSSPERGALLCLCAMLEEGKTTTGKESVSLNHNLEERHPPIQSTCFGFHDTKI